MHKYIYQNTIAAAAWKEILRLLTNTHKNFCTLQQLIFFIISRMNGHQPFHDEKKEIKRNEGDLQLGYYYELLSSTIFPFFSLSTYFMNIRRYFINVHLHSLYGGNQYNNIGMIAFHKFNFFPFSCVSSFSMRREKKENQ